MYLSDDLGAFGRANRIDVSQFPVNYPQAASTSMDFLYQPRLKHLHDLETLASRGYRTIMCYVIQRDDVNHFQPSVIDPIYRTAFYRAKKNGVEMYAVKFEWNEYGEAQFKGCVDIITY